MLGLFHLLERANEYSLQLSKRRSWENVEKAHNVITKELQQGNIFIIRNNSLITSSITISETSDVWDELGKVSKALYIKKFMKDVDKAHPDEGNMLLKFAAQEAEKRKKDFIRCDAVSDNLGLITYYKKMGFQEKGSLVYKPNYRQGILLEILTSQLLLYTEKVK